MVRKLKDYNPLRWLEEGFPADDSASPPLPIPFTHGTDMMPNINHLVRLDAYRAFIDDEDLRGRLVLDVGGQNFFAEQFKKLYSCQIEYTLETDFNYSVKAPRPQYDVITCFEILEHTMNPFLLVRSLYEMLPEGGILYLSTPKLAWISIYLSALHFSEYKQSKLEILFAHAGFRVAKKDIFVHCPWWWYFYPLKPMIKAFLLRGVIYKLVK